jgi:hypothetical protein
MTVVLLRAVALLLGTFLCGLICARKLYFFLLWRAGLIGSREYVSLVLAAVSWLLLALDAMVGIGFRALTQAQATWELPLLMLAVTRTGGYRTPSDQKLAKLEGASPFDGQHAFSKHQKWKAEALDFAVIGPGEDYIEDGADPRYAWVGREFEKKGFSWGGRWRTSKKGPDYDHVEKRGPNPTKPIVDASYSAFVAYTGAGVTKEA